MAAEHGHLERVRLLTTTGADPNGVDVDLLVVTQRNGLGDMISTALRLVSSAKDVPSVGSVSWFTSTAESAFVTRSERLFEGGRHYRESPAQAPPKALNPFWSACFHEDGWDQGGAAGRISSHQMMWIHNHSQLSKILCMTRVHWACLMGRQISDPSGHVEGLQTMVSWLVDRNEEPLPMPDVYGNTPMHYRACLGGAHNSLPTNMKTSTVENFWDKQRNLFGHTPQ